MSSTTRQVQSSYLILTSLNTLAASFIWGVNTLFFLDAGLSNTEAFAINAMFTAGMVLFEIPTGVIADTIGRRASFLMGVVTLFFATIAFYFLWQSRISFWPWVFVSLFVGLGFTFFSGAVEAWLVDALNATGFKGSLENVFAKGQIAHGVAMLVGATTGGYLAQVGDLGLPYLVRCGFLFLSFLFALWAMKDLGFQPRRVENLHDEMKSILSHSLDLGFRKKNIRWMIFTSPFIMGTAVYSFYAAQPYLLELYGEKEAYLVAGLAASLVAGAQIIGGLMVPGIRKLFSKRTHFIMTMTISASVALGLIVLCKNFWWLLTLLSIWAFMVAAISPIKQAYLNNCIPSEQRATLLSFDSLMGSLGGSIFQPLLGRSADIWGYGASFLIAACIQVLALPFLLLAKKEQSKADQLSP